MGMDGSGSGLFELVVLNAHRKNGEENIRNLGKLDCL